MVMPAATNLAPDKLRRRKKRIGIMAIALLLLFTVLALLGVISFIVWILADLAVALIANLLLRRVGRGNP
jgi:nitrate reductase NapE component